MGIYRVRTVWTGVAGSPYYTNLYFTEIGGTAQEARNAVNAVFANMLASIRNDLRFTIETDVAVIDEVTGDIERVETTTTALTGVGTSTEDPLPPADQALMRLRTGVYNGGREIRGRVFVPGGVQTASDGGVPTVAHRNELNTRFAVLVTITSAQWVVWAKSRGAIAVVTSATAWDQWAVLRSRRD